MAPPVLIVSGGPAVGKSTVSRLLTGSLQPSVHLPIEVLLRLFDDPFPDAGSSEGAYRYGVVGAAAAAAAAQFALGGYIVILDSPMFPSGADGVAKICARRGVEVHYAVLRTDLGTCLARSQRRGAAGPSDVEAFRSLHNRFVDLGDREGHVIDASGPPESVADAVLYGFNSRLLKVQEAPMSS
jgi:tRNA uridine 5-carbamoylmethylation protein Kti12